MLWRAREKKTGDEIMPKYGNLTSPIREFWVYGNMEVLAGYDSSSSDENAKILVDPADKQVKNPKKVQLMCQCCF